MNPNTFLPPHPHAGLLYILLVTLVLSRVLYSMQELVFHVLAWHTMLLTAIFMLLNWMSCHSHSEQLLSLFLCPLTENY